MAAFENVPWIPTSDQFLKAIQLGSDRAMQIAKLTNDANEQASRRAGGGGGFPRFGGGGFSRPEPAPEPAAPRTDGFSNDGMTYSVANDQSKIVGEALAREEARQAYNSSLNNPLVNKSIFKPIPAPITPQQEQAAKKIFEVGNQVVEVNPLTGKSNVLFTQPPQPTKETAYNIPVMENFMSAPTTLKMTPSQLQSQIGSLPEFARTNEITKVVLGMANRTGSQKTNEVVRSLKDGRKAVFDADTKQFLRYAD